MEMASMVRQVLLLSNICFVLLACQPSQKLNISFYVKENDTSFVHNQGVLMYKNLPFSGNQIALFQNGDTSKITPFLNGKLNGWSKVWYSKGVLSEQRFYKNGKKQGEHKAWWTDGKLKFLYHFKDDEHEGIQQSWFQNGKLAEVFNYKSGHEEGQQQMWFEDGILKANYVIKEGRRFGLPGVKKCVSVVEKDTFRTKK